MKQSNEKSPKIASLVRNRIQQSEDRIWRMNDFSNYPLLPVAQALSRLTKAGVIQRINKGVYYKPKETSFGQSRPNLSKLRELAHKKNKLIPSGITAANLLGFCTQTPTRGEFSTTAASLPRKLIGNKIIVHTRRPATWEKLSQIEAALLEFMRSGGKDSELSPRETIQRLIKFLKKDDHFLNLIKVSYKEPPRVRAILGALGEQIKADRKLIDKLHSSLNSLSRFNFGLFIELPNAKNWHAKKEE